MSVAILLERRKIVAQQTGDKKHPPGEASVLKQQPKSARFWRRFQSSIRNYCQGSRDQTDIALIRADSRDSFLETVLRCTTPFWAPRIICGSAARNAANACSLFPDAMASSTFLTEVRRRPRRPRFTSVRRLICRMRFFAD
jgi:hypothetical protein